MNTSPPLSVLAVLGLTFLFAGCVAQQPLQKRWANEKHPVVTYKHDVVGAPGLWISASILDSAPPTGVKDLPDHAGAAYLTQLGRFAASSDDFKTAASKPVSTKKGLVDLSSVDRTLVITVAKNDYEPADRLIRTKIVLVPRNFAFSNYSVAATAYTTVGIETIGSSQTATNGFELDPTLSGKLVGTAKFTAGTSSTNTDSAVVSQQIEQLTVYVQGGNLVVYRESERGLDLTGNTLIKVSLRPLSDDVIEERYLVSDAKIVDGQGIPYTQKKAAITLGLARLVPIDDYVVDAKFDFIVRHVDGDGVATYSESDDQVTLWSDASEAATNSFTLVPARELAVPRWFIRDRASRDNVKVDGFAGNNATSGTQLYFTDFELVQQFVHWLKAEHATAVGAQRLLFNDKPFADIIARNHAYPEFCIVRVQENTSKKQQTVGHDASEKSRDGCND